MQFNKFIIAAVLSLASVVCVSKPILSASSTDGRSVLTLSDDKCTNQPALARIKPEFKDQFFAGEYARQGQKTLQLCWSPHDGNVYIMDEEGTRGVVTQDAFQDVEGV
jgi:hypothetical protein